MGYSILALLIWSSSFVAGKYSYSVADPVVVTQIRFVLAAMIVMPTFISAYRQVPIHLRLKIWLLALLNFPIAFLLQFIGLNHTSASSAVTIVGMEPILTILIGHLFFRQHAKLLDWLMSAVAFFGIALIVTSSKDGGGVSVFGVSLILLAAITFVFCIYLGKNIMQEIEPKVYTSVIIGLAPLLGIPFTLILTDDWTITPNYSGIFAILYLGLACSWLAMLFWNKGLQQISTSTSGLLIALEPVFGVLMAILILDEKLTFLTSLGMILVISATLISVGTPILRQRIKNRRAQNNLLPEK